jgi:acyl-CoA thioester hydrolase
MGHMNVRHYLARANDGLAALLASWGYGPRALSERGLMLRARDQHVRFSCELRPGTGYAIHAGVLGDRAPISTFEELRTVQDEVSATIVSELALHDSSTGDPVAWPAGLLESARSARCELPPYAAVRGVTESPTRARPTLERALALGMSPGYLGLVQAEDCDALGVMREATCLGRIADGIAHFFRALYHDSGRPDGVGGAALEYRFVFHAWPRLSDVIEIRSALSALGPKTLQITHHLFDRSSGSCFASAQAVVVWFDLKARRALAIPETVRAVLQTRIIEGLTL